MGNHPWPLANTLPTGYQPLTLGDLREILSLIESANDNTRIWLDNYWQPVRQITQRPVELIYHGEDGIHLA